MSYISTYNSHDSDNFIDHLCYIFGIIVALIGLIIIIQSILSVYDNQSELAKDQGFDSFMHGIWMIIYGIALFVSGHMGVPVIFGGFGIYFSNKKIFRIFSIFIAIILILDSLLKPMILILDALLSIIFL